MFPVTLALLGLMVLLEIQVQLVLLDRVDLLDREEIREVQETQDRVDHLVHPVLSGIRVSLGLQGLRDHWALQAHQEVQELPDHLDLPDRSVHPAQSDLVDSRVQLVQLDQRDLQGNPDHRDLKGTRVLQDNPDKEEILVQLDRLVLPEPPEIRVSKVLQVRRVSLARLVPEVMWAHPVHKDHEAIRVRLETKEAQEILGHLDPADPVVHLVRLEILGRGELPVPRVYQEILALKVVLALLVLPDQLVT